jgi:hypothetical protein
MHKKDYIAIAAAIRETSFEWHHRGELVSKLVRIFQEDNIRFDAPRFRAACEPTRPVAR